MFLDESALELPEDAEDASFANHLLESLAQELGIGAFLFCHLRERPHLACSWGLPSEPLHGSSSHLLSDVLEECTRHFQAPHVHSLPESLVESFRRMKTNLQLTNSVVFLPFLLGKERWACFALLSVTGIQADNQVLLEGVKQLLFPLNALAMRGALKLRLKTLETYVKEVGHDIASGVQACRAKLHNIARGLVQGEAARKKAMEAENEIMGVYRVAENVGFVVDPDYNIGLGVDFDVCDAVKKAIDQHQAEAAERHIQIEPHCRQPVTAWGDRAAIESATAQILLNAIKYAEGSSTIVVKVSMTGESVRVSVQDRGIPLHDDESQEIWDIGFRGRDALERHVNGSGIGLFTVRKIVQAHGGKVWASCPNPRDRRFVEFGFQIPLQRITTKTKLLGIREE